ncbi:MFS transporter [Halorussus caseinilyticus]|uniref:MFS transporter n=1 Tax=Halorussus caseinilyticus TaxID=3034025 RepID=UPI0023E78133|nr:MFS transporter [Halorussus sp. DT72]
MRLPAVPGRDSLPDLSRETLLVVALVGGAEFVNHTYLVLFPPILGVLSNDFGVSLATLGIAMGVQGAANTVFQLPFGYLADNYDRRLALGLSLGLSTASVFLVAFAPTFEVLLVGQALLGIGIAGHHPAHFPLLADATPEHLRARAFSVRGFLGSLGFGFPPVFFAAVLGFRGLTWRGAIALVGAFGALYALFTLFAFQRWVGEDVTAPETGSAGSASASADADDPSSADDAAASSADSSASRLAGVRRELRAVLASPGVLALALLALVASTASWGLTSYAVVLLRQGYGLALDAANLTLSAMFVVGALAVLVGGDLSDRFSPGPLIVGSYAAVVVFVGLLASTAIPALAAVACLLVVGGTRALAGPARSKLADGLSARSDLGRTFAVVTVGTMTGSALAPPLFGALIERSGLRVAFAAIAGISALAVLVTLFVLYRQGTGRSARAGVEAE